MLKYINLLGYFVTAYSVFRSLLAITYQLKFNLIQRPKMWCKMRSRRKEYEKQSEEIQEFYYKNLCVKEQPKEKQDEEKSDIAAVHNLFDSNFKKGEIYILFFI